MSKNLAFQKIQQSLLNWKPSDHDTESEDEPRSDCKNISLDNTCLR